MGLIDASGRARWLEALIVLSLAFALWRPDFMFFWRDDWDFLSGMRGAGPGWLLDDHYGHVLPFFKLLYWGEMAILGTNTQWHGFVSVILFGLGSVALLRLMLKVTSPVPAWAAVVLYTAHPMMFQHVGWIFEQCMSAHLFFQALSVLCFLRWQQTERNVHLALTLVFVVVQNYFFGNGIFLPLALATGVWLFRRPERPLIMELRRVAPFLLLFVLFVGLQLGLGGERSTKQLSIGGIPGMLHASAYLFGVNASRMILLREGALGPLTPWLTSMIVLTVIVRALMRRSRDRRLAWLYVLWYGSVFCSVPIMRGGSLVGAEVPHYYTVLSMAPLLLLAEHALGGQRVWDRLPRPALLVFCAGLAIGIVAVDGELRRLVSFRHFRNEQLMRKSVDQGTPYFGLDDPYFTAARYRVQDARGIYLHWHARNRFGPVIGYERDPANWTRDQSIVGAE